MDLEISRNMALLVGDEKHENAYLSTLEVLRALYEEVLHHDPARPEDPDRDRFYLSKGHGPAAYYAVLCAQGYFPQSLLVGWTGFDSPLGLHPDRNLIPGVEISSGSLGHGLPLAVGSALGLRAQGIAARIFVLVGDAELDEGSNHEAIEYAAAAALSNLTVIVVDNRSASYAVPGRIAERFATEGWQVATVDGRDRAAIARALSTRPVGRPSVVVAEVLPLRGEEAA